LTSSDPLIALGFLGIPAELAGGEPAAVYDFALAALLLLSGLAMTLLVSDWTGVPAAGLVAGLLYAFDATRLRDIDHPFVYDTSWTLLALFFARRLLARGRWRDAVGLALSAALQLGTSLYAMLAAASVAAPLLVWLLWLYRLRHARLGQLACATALVLCAAWLVLGPYLAVRSAGEVPLQQAPYFAAWADFAPGGRRAAAWSSVALALAGLVLPSRRALSGLAGDPRPALVAGALLAALLATGPAFSALSALLPGLDMVRVPARIGSGVQLALCLMAGIGAAALIRSARSAALAAALQAALLLAVGLETVVLPNLAEPSHVRFEALRVRPPRESVAFFEALGRMGNAGPVLELPLETTPYESMQHAPARIVLAAYHRRRTSACFGSFVPPARQRLAEVSARFDALRGLGFTTLVLHQALPGAVATRRWLDQNVGPDGPLRVLLEDASLVAYSIEGPSARGAVSASP
jgi:hypothetical protein